VKKVTSDTPSDQPPIDDDIPLPEEPLRLIPKHEIDELIRFQGLSQREQLYYKWTQDPKQCTAPHVAEIVVGAFLGEKEAIEAVGAPLMDLVAAQTEDGVNVLLRTNELNEVSLIKREYLSQKVARFTRSLTESRGKIFNHVIFSDRLNEEISNKIRKVIPPIDYASIKPFAFKSDNSMSWKRLTFDPADIPTPLFDGIIERVESPQQAQALLAFIGALFDETVRLDKVLWLHGEGGDGKGSLFSLLSDIFGVSAGTVETSMESLKDKHWTANFEGKRVMYDADCQNPKLIYHPKFLQVTGDDIIPARPIGEGWRKIVNNSMLLIGSNEAPDFRGTRAQGRRLLYVKMLRRTEVDDLPEFRHLLKLEAPGIVWKALMAWDRVKLDKRGVIESDVAVLNQLKEDNTADFLDALMKVANSHSEGFCLQVDLWHRLDNWLPGIRRNNFLKRDFKRWLIDSGIAREHKPSGKARTFIGITLKSIL
jgi:hypothetical protein